MERAGEPVFLVREGGLRVCRRGLNRRVSFVERAGEPVFLVREGGFRVCSRGLNRRVSYQLQLLE